MNTPTFNQTVAVFLLRALLGLIFLMQGVAKIFNWGINNIYENSFKSYEDLLPKFLVVFTAYFTSYVELIGGLFLVLGFFRNYTLYFLGAVLLIVTFGHGLSSGIWELHHVMYRAILLIAILLLPEEWDKWQGSNFIKK